MVTFVDTPVVLCQYHTLLRTAALAAALLFCLSGACLHRSPGHPPSSWDQQRPFPVSLRHTVVCRLLHQCNAMIHHSFSVHHLKSHWLMGLGLSHAYQPVYVSHDIIKVFRSFDVIGTHMDNYCIRVTKVPLFNNHLQLFSPDAWESSSLPIWTICSHILYDGVTQY